jgi:hypothetical protein
MATIFNIQPILSCMVFYSPKSQVPDTRIVFLIFITLEGFLLIKDNPLYKYLFTGIVATIFLFNIVFVISKLEGFMHPMKFYANKIDKAMYLESTLNSPYNAYQFINSKTLKNYISLIITFRLRKKRISGSKYRPMSIYIFKYYR